MAIRKAERNKTIELSPKEQKFYAARCIKLKAKAAPEDIFDKTIYQDSG